MILVNLLTYILIFLFVWFTSFLWHELMHCFEAWRQGSTAQYIRPKFNQLHMYMYYDGQVYNKNLISFAGGVYTSPVMFLLMLMSTGVWQFAWFTLGWVQLAYGIFEGFYSHKMPSDVYRVARYWLYFWVVLGCIVFWVVMYFYG